MSQAKTLTTAELDQVLGYISTRKFALRNRVLLLTGYWSGMRVGEIASLTISDVVNADGTIKAEIRLSAEQTKGRHPRTVFLPEKLRAELAHFVEFRRPFDFDQPLFTTASGKGFTVEQSLKGHAIHKWKSYEMGKQLNITPEHVTTIYDSAKTAKAKRSSMRTDQSRNNASALSLISNVEIGKFPCKAKVIAKPRWTETQQTELDQADSDGQWPPKNWLDLEHTFMLPDQGLDLFNDQGAPIVRELAILAAMNNMEKSFLFSRHTAG